MYVQSFKENDEWAKTNNYLGSVAERFPPLHIMPLFVLRSEKKISFLLYLLIILLFLTGLTYSLMLPKKSTLYKGLKNFL